MRAGIMNERRQGSDSLFRFLAEAWQDPVSKEVEVLDALESLGRLESEFAVQALLPYLFPVPTGDEKAWGLRSTFFSRRGRDRGLSPEWKRIRDASREALSRIFGRLSLDRYPRLDRLVRSSSDWLPRGQLGWVGFRPVDILQVPDDPALLGLLTFHSDGFVREAALERFGKLPTRSAFPFFLLRINDWVSPIRDRAKAWICDVVREGGLETVIAHHLSLVVKLSEYERSDHRQVQDLLFDAVLSQDDHEALRAVLREGDSGNRRAVASVVVRLELPKQVPFILESIRDRDPIVRLWAARSLEPLETGGFEAARTLREICLRDRNPGIAVQGIYSLVRRGGEDSRKRLVDLVVHPAASIRHAARFYLGKLGDPPDFRRIYRSRLPGSGSSRSAAALITGLAEVGVKEDIGALTPFLGDTSPRVVRAALRALSHLDHEFARPTLIEGIFHGVPSVARTANQLLGPRFLRDEAPVFLKLVTTREPGASVVDLVRAAKKLGPWDALGVLLSLAAGLRHSVSDDVSRALLSWEPNQDRPLYDASPPSETQGRALWDAFLAARPFLADSAAERLATKIGTFLP